MNGVKPRALIIGAWCELMQPLFSLFSRAGFEIDVITLKFSLHKNSFVATSIEVKEFCYFEDVLRKVDLDKYDLVVPCDDDVLLRVRNSNLDLVTKNKILPVIGEQYFEHIASKIALSRTLFEAKIPTPSFLVAQGRKQVVESSHLLGFPVMIKVDFSGGGMGVFACYEASDIDAIPEERFLEPLLIQKKITGREIDLSGFFCQGKIIDFYFSITTKVISPFGPAAVRKYFLDEKNRPELLIQVQNLAQALGVNGFINLAGIEDDKGIIHFFEADMRPTVWADVGKFLGEDLAPKIKKYFKNKEAMQVLSSDISHSDKIVTIPHFLRLKFWEIFLNRYRCWKYMSRSDWRWLFFEVYYRKSKMFLWRINRIPTLTIRAFLPRKEDRILLKLKWKNLFRLA